MSITRTILRVSGLAALAGAGYVLLQEPGLVAGPATPAPQADVAGTTSPDTPPTAPAMPMVADGASGVRLPAQAVRAPETTATIPMALETRDGLPLVPTSAPVEADGGASIELSPFGLPCGLTVHSEGMPGALVALDIMAPCRPGMQVEIEHAGLTVTAKTDAAGLLTLDFPALETPAFFSLRMADGEEAFTLAGLPDLIDLGRVAVSWEGDLGIELHAFEGGAAFGTPGHVWQESPGSAADAAIGAGGFLSRLGDASLETPHLAQIYTYPRSLSEMPRLSVDIPVTEETCGRSARASSHQVAESGRVETQPITLVLPGCDAVGDYLVLQNLFDTLRLASN